jgi:hypothetical protein
MALYSFIYLLNTNGAVDVENNKLSGSHQSGIVIMGGPYSSVIVQGNTIGQNSSWTDGYGIELSSGAQNFVIANNTITPVYGRGIMIDALNGGTIQNGVINNNYVEVQEKPDLEYGQTGLEVTALRIRTLDSPSVIRNLKISNNTFYAHTDVGLDHAALGCRITLINDKGQMNNANIQVVGNLFKAIVRSSDPIVNSARALTLSRVDAGTGLTFTGNTFESNSTSLNFGDSDGINESDVSFISNTIKKSSDGVALNYSGIQAAYWISTAAGIRVIDMAYQNGATSNIAFGGSGAKDFSVGWLVGVTVNDASGAAVLGATISVFDTNGTLVYTGITNASGQITGIPLITANYSQTTSDPTQITINSWGPFTLKVTKGNKTSLQTINPTTDTSLALTLD